MFSYTHSAGKILVMSFLAAVLASAGTSAFSFLRAFDCTRTRDERFDFSVFLIAPCCLFFLFLLCFYHVFLTVVSEGEVEMTDLNKNVAELKHKISSLEFDIKDAMEQRYMKFAVVSRDAASLLDTAQSYSNQINNLISRIDNQVC